MTSRRRTAVAPLSDHRERCPLAPVLRNGRRRLVVNTLDAVERPLELESLARRVAAREVGVPASVVAEEAIRQVGLSLYNTHLPLLCARGVVTIRSESGVVAPGDRFVGAVSYLSEGGRS